jgi:hypothetical protein
LIAEIYRGWYSSEFQGRRGSGKESSLLPAVHSLKGTSETFTERNSLVISEIGSGFMDLRSFDNKWFGCYSGASNKDFCGGYILSLESV